MRIVSLLASATQTICELGAGNALVGRSHECDNPAYVRNLPACTRPGFDTSMSSREIDAEVRRRVQAEEPLYYVDSAGIERLKPDILFAQSHCEVCAVTPGDINRSACGLPQSQIVGLQAGDLEGIFADIMSIAEAIDRCDEGDALVNKLKQRLARLKAALIHRRCPSLVMIEWTDPVYAMGNWGPELVEFACGNLLIGNPKAYSNTINWSDVCAADPEFLIIAPCGYDLMRTIRELPILAEYPGWQQLRAVRTGNVFFADGNLYFNRSGITAIDTAELIADILHETSFHRPSNRMPSWRGISAFA